jgi:hypothetical protein
VGIEKLENEEPSYGSYSKLVLISTINGIRVCTTCDVVACHVMSCSLNFSTEYFNLKVLLRYDGGDGLKVVNNYGKLLENLFFAEMSSDYFFKILVI